MFACIGQVNSSAACPDFSIRRNGYSGFSIVQRCPRASTISWKPWCNSNMIGYSFQSEKQNSLRVTRCTKSWFQQISFRIHSWVSWKISRQSSSGPVMRSPGAHLQPFFAMFCSLIVFSSMHSTISFCHMRQGCIGSSTSGRPSRDAVTLLPDDDVRPAAVPSIHYSKADSLLLFRCSKALWRPRRS